MYGSVGVKSLAAIHKTSHFQSDSQFSKSVVGSTLSLYLKWYLRPGSNPTSFYILPFARFVHLRLFIMFLLGLLTFNLQKCMRPHFKGIFAGYLYIQYKVFT